MVKGWLLEVSDRIAGKLIASYVGAKSVRSNQAIKFTNASNVELEERSRFCAGIDDRLIESPYLLNYEILDVSCFNFSFTPSTSRDHGFRRRLQEADSQLGILVVEYSVTGLYRPANRTEEVERKEEFGSLVEVSVFW